MQHFMGVLAIVSGGDIGVSERISVAAGRLFRFFSR